MRAPCVPFRAGATICCARAVRKRAWLDDPDERVEGLAVDLTFLPALNAVLNAVATALLLAGRRLVKRGAIDAHRRVMLAAFTVSSLFLASYVVHKWSRSFENTPFHGEGALKALYLAILFSHLTLAMTVPFLALTLVVLGLRGRIERHRRLARVAWPIWIYVSITGVVIYVMLYRLNPDAP